MIKSANALFSLLSPAASLTCLTQASHCLIYKGINVMFTDTLITRGRVSTQTSDSRNMCSLFLNAMFSRKLNEVLQSFFFVMIHCQIIFDNSPMTVLTNCNCLLKGLGLLYYRIVKKIYQFVEMDDPSAKILISGTVLIFPFRTGIWYSTLEVQHPGPRLNIKTVLSAYGVFHVKDKTAVRTSYL